MKRLNLLLLLLCISLLFTYLYHSEKKEHLIAQKKLGLEQIKDQVTAKLVSNNPLPEEFDINGDKYLIEYTFNEDLTKYIKKLLKRYRSDYSAVVVIENATGNILSAVGYERRKNTFTNALPFTVSHPSASLFKIVSSANLLEKEHIDPNTKFSYSGKGTTLYKYQLKKGRTRWHRFQSLEKAFAHSNNVIFGKAAIYNTTGEDMFQTAVEFGFNKEIMADIHLSKSIFRMPESQYNLAELASGFNKKTTISPVHGAVLSSIVANNGVFRPPRIISKVKTSEGNEVVWSPDDKTTQAIAPFTSRELQRMMTLAVDRGTARGFRRMKSSLRNQLELGGKT
ncbi:MAG: penicillin-binding transpeptidase domain-containing protein, partial [Bdellovibrionales bacterium]|nr:penicillin-binding transpeptidase domain-containing protein [Bdellovibrionales bacterium]